MDILQKAGEILVECGYAGCIDDKYGLHIRPYHQETDGMNVRVQLFDMGSDTLEGRRQADAIEDWIAENHRKLWSQAESSPECRSIVSRHQWRLDRIKWCLEKLCSA